MNKLRNATVFMAVISLLFFVFNTWFDVKISSGVTDIIELIAGMLVALGILTNTGSEPQKITKESILIKLKSPLAVGAVFALISYIAYRQMTVADADIILKILDTIITAIFGFSVYNNPNNAEALR